MGESGAHGLPARSSLKETMNILRGWGEKGTLINSFRIVTAAIRSVCETQLPGQRLERPQRSPSCHCRDALFKRCDYRRDGVRGVSKEEGAAFRERSALVQENRLSYRGR